MAVFDPEVQPLNDPSYTRDSRGVDVPRTPSPDGVAQNQIMPRGVDTPDRSAEYLGKAAAYSMEASGADKKGLGDLFSQIVGIGDFAFKGADFMIKKGIEREVYDRANQEREEYTARLEGMLGGKAARSNLFSDGGDGGSDGGEGEDSLPGELEDLPNSLGQLKSASDAGKISNTYYTGRLLAHAKDLRAKYPMYREYIDQQFAQVTGMNPANARISALTQDINRAVSSQAGEQRRMVAEVMKYNGWAYGGINSIQALQKIYSGEWTSMADVARWRYPADKLESDYKIKETIAKDSKLDREQRAIAGEDAAKSLLAGESNKLINNLMAGFEVSNPDDLILKLKENKDPTWWRDRVTELKHTKLQYEKKMRAAFNARNGNELSLAQTMQIKPADIDAYIKQYGSNDLQNIIDALNDQNANGVAGAVNRAQAKVDSAVEMMLNEPGLREFSLPMAAASKVFGQNNVVAQDQVNRILEEKFAPKFKQVMHAWASKLRNGSSLGQETSFNEFFTEMKSKGALTRSDSSKMVNIVSDIANPKVSDPEKHSIARSAFGERNLGFVGRIAAEYQDADGRRIEGPWGVFEKWTTPAIAKEIKRLDAQYPGLWKDYTTWAEKTLTSDLLPQDIQRLNSLNEGDQNFEVQWKTSENGVRQIVLRPTKQSDDGTNRLLAQHMAGGALAGQRDLERTVTRFNSALAKYSNIAKENGDDADAFILRSLYGDGGKGNLLNKGLFSDQILQALKASRVKEELDKQNNARRK